MNRIVSALVVIAFAAAAYAEPPHDWAKIENTKKRTPVAISLWSGEHIYGLLEDANPYGLRVSPFDLGSERYLKRTEIWRIARMQHHRLPNPRKWMLIGAIGGGTIGVTAGAISDARNHSHTERWLTAGFGGAVLGFFASGAVLAGIGIVDVASDLAHHNKILYESAEPPPSLSDHDQSPTTDR